MLHTLRFSLQNAVYSIMLPFLFHVLFTFYTQGVLKFKGNLWCQKVKLNISKYAEVWSPQQQERYMGSDLLLLFLLILLPLALQPAVGFGLSNNTSPFVPICHQLSTSSHSHHLKISFYFFSPTFPGSSPSSRPFQFLSEDLFGHPILLHCRLVTQQTYPLPLYPLYYIFSFIQLFQFSILPNFPFLIFILMYQ